MLPVAQFLNGFTFSVARLHEQYNLRPFSVHATYAADKARARLARCRALCLTVGRAPARCAAEPHGRPPLPA